MKYLGRGLALILLAGLVPVTALAAGPPATMSATLQVTGKFKANMGFKHVTASAKVRYAKGDAYITLTTDNLPRATTIGEKAYVLFAADGNMKDRVGALHGSGMMAGVTGEVMMAKVQDLYVYATPSMNTMHAMGKLVLSGMVG